jgi:hypothetical protein
MVQLLVQLYGPCMGGMPGPCRLLVRLLGQFRPTPIRPSMVVEPGGYDWCGVVANLVVNPTPNV